MTRAPFQLDPKVRAKRVGLPNAVTVESRTIGTPMTYVLETANLSRTGMLLHLCRNNKVPYRVNTLIEMTVDRDARLLMRPIRCLGKIVRVAEDSDHRPQFGVQIIEMDRQDLDTWENALTRLEGTANALPHAS